jgi:hypothetical protein
MSSNPYRRRKTTIRAKMLDRDMSGAVERRL